MIFDCFSVDKFFLPPVQNLPTSLSRLQGAVDTQVYCVCCLFLASVANRGSVRAPVGVWGEAGEGGSLERIPNEIGRTFGSGSSPRFAASIIDRI
jgi:hypothetical protein